MSLRCRWYFGKCLSSFENLSLHCHLVHASPVWRVVESVFRLLRSCSSCSRYTIVRNLDIQEASGAFATVFAWTRCHFLGEKDLVYDILRKLETCAVECRCHREVHIQFPLKFLPGPWKAFQLGGLADLVSSRRPQPHLIWRFDTWQLFVNVEFLQLILRHHRVRIFQGASVLKEPSLEVLGVTATHLHYRPDTGTFWMWLTASFTKRELMIEREILVSPFTPVLREAEYWLKKAWKARHLIFWPSQLASSEGIVFHVILLRLFLPSLSILFCCMNCP